MKRNRIDPDLRITFDGTRVTSVEVMTTPWTEAALVPLEGLDEDFGAVAAEVFGWCLLHAKVHQYFVGGSFDPARITSMTLVWTAISGVTHIRLGDGSRPEVHLIRVKAPLLWETANGMVEAIHRAWRRADAEALGIPVGLLPLGGASL